MGRQKVHWLNKRKFGLPGGRFANSRKSFNSGRPRYVYKVSVSTDKSMKMTFFRRRKLQSYKRTTRTLSGNANGQYVMRNVYRDDNSKGLKFTLTKIHPLNEKGYRLTNIDCLQQHLTEVTVHVALCEKARSVAAAGHSPINIVSEQRTCGLASVLLVKCQGCDQSFSFVTSPKLQTTKGKRYDVNVRAVWGSVATGNGAAHLNELLGTCDSPGISQPSFTTIEQEIGDWWQELLQSEFRKAGEEERRIAIEKGNFHDGVPCITVIADGGWNKRSHKHTYNALGGVGVIIGKETGKLLHMGIRNKYCYICCKAEREKIVPKSHRCFQNWHDSSQAMESDIIVEGFKNAERLHGLRYTRLIADGDSSVFAKIQEEVPIWGKHVMKEECANHVCKCLRSNLEKLVESVPQYKGKDKLTKAVRVRLVSAVRCAIRMRSTDTNRQKAKHALAHDIRNSIHHIFGKHENCSDFCRARDKKIQSETTSDSDGINPSMASLCDDQASYWTEGSSVVDQELSRCGSDLLYTNKDSDMIQDVAKILDRVALKSDRLLLNATSNLAECWMHIRTKFDGGKLYNNCSRGSWSTRCYGGALRMNLGPQWSPTAWQYSTGTLPGHHYTKLFKERDKQLISSTTSKQQPEASASRWKRKMKSYQQSRTKEAKMAYGKEAKDVIPDVSSSDLILRQSEFLEKHINISKERIDAIERTTRDQSNSSAWHNERKKRLTASVFGSVVKRNSCLPVTPLVRRLLYSNFAGNLHTRRGLQQERVTLHEYALKKAEEGVNVHVENTGLLINASNKFLGASPDGRVMEAGGTSGLVEVKNLLHSKKINLTQAAKNEKNFCLTIISGKLSLKTSHDYYYQCQGLMAVAECPWVDFVVRTIDPYQLHVERITRDKSLWQMTMLPKLEAFYQKALLPELSAPREGKVPGIREPGVWFQQEPRRRTQKSKVGPKQNRVSTVKPPTTSTDTAAASTSSRRGARTRVKFVGRQISHEWTVDEATKCTKWYSGTVLDVISGTDGSDNAVHEVVYDGDDKVYEIDHLMKDYKASSLRFIDL